MAVYILDTNTFTLFFQQHPRVVANVAARVGDTVGLTAVSVEEILTGWYTYGRRAKTNAAKAAASRLLTESAALLGRFPIYPLTEDALDRYDQLIKLKLNVGGMDLKIAAVALELGATGVTNNVRDFGRVPLLTTEDWSV